MKIKLLLIAMLCSVSCAMAQDKPSFKPGELWKDNNDVHINAHGGGVLYHEGTYYWFGEHKVAGDAGNRAQVGVHCYSSTDLYNWTDRGIALAVSDDPTSDITKGCILERPKVLYCAKTKKFVMWFHLEPKGKGYGGALIGIAQADKVTGPYTYLRSTRSTPRTWPVNVLPLHKQPVAEAYRAERSNLQPTEHPDSVNTLGRDFEKGQHSRDMTLFLDDDGKAYHICSSESNSTIHIAELTDDFLDFTGKYVRAFAGRRMEAPAVFKKDGLYYFMGSDCTGWAPNPARSAVAPSIWGPWTELGNPCVDDDKETTYHSQSTFFLPVAGKQNAIIYMGDRWRPKDAIDGRYIWLPVEFENNRFILRWYDEWDLSCFDKASTSTSD
ncbi:MAG: glycoside hydrolase family 43 protein [Bacteroides sp.]|nr:glycoside hydrolase family 43 protein [Bacteroides sp.]